uniref:Uncharacterized protein n=1 Tax=Cacopsylla melanoneura TaxID=428564 RepID=A0A8D8RCA9_9HEMI
MCLVCLVFKYWLHTKYHLFSPLTCSMVYGTRLLSPLTYSSMVLMRLLTQLQELPIFPVSLILFEYFNPLEAFFLSFQKKIKLTFCGRGELLEVTLLLHDLHVKVVFVRCIRQQKVNTFYTSI